MAEQPGDRPAIPWETEPIAFFHALLAGAAVPLTGNLSGDTPSPGLDAEPPLLEEEPALWPHGS